MNTVIKHIEYLISRKDCVIIPGIGAILAIDTPARIVSDMGMILPPSRSYSFNSDLSVSDGVLVASIARGLSISFETASRRVEQATESIMNSLQAHGSFALGSLGSLVYDSDSHSISFNAADALITNARSFWLSPVNIPNKEETIQADGSMVIAIEKGAFMKRVFRLAASIALLIGICFIASTPVAVKDAALASLAPELRQLTPADFSTPTPAPKLSIVASPKKTDEAPIKVDELQQESVARYYVLVGTLRNMEEAEVFRSRYKNMNLHTIVRGKYVSVYSSSFLSKDEAISECRKALAIFPDAWICKI